MEPTAATSSESHSNHLVLIFITRITAVHLTAKSQYTDFVIMACSCRPGMRAQS